MKKVKLGIVGATGMVGQQFIKLLENRSFPVDEVKLFASPRSVGKKIKCCAKERVVEQLSEDCFCGLDFVFFSAGGSISQKWAPLAALSGAFAIDNSSVFRLNPDHLLVVPEVNGEQLNGISPQVIANPNCSTIQLVVALAPLKKRFGLKSVQVASYQAVSGAGYEAYNELIEQSVDPNKKIESKRFPRPIAYNCIPQIGDFDDHGFCVEETKIMLETKKILNDDHLDVSAFTVRVPVLNGHSEVVWVTFNQEAKQEDLLEAFEQAPGLHLHSKDNDYPTAKEISGDEPVHVGRVHSAGKKDKWIFWVVADNLLKGAALNGLQIAERLF